MTGDDVEPFECYEAAATGESGVGITISVNDPEGSWLSWAETVKLHAWLSKLIDAAKL